MKSQATPATRPRTNTRLATWLMVVSMAATPLVRGQSPAQEGSQGKAGDATDGVVWGALVYATNGEAPDVAIPEERGRFDQVVPRLAKAFQFEAFHLLGQHSQEIFSAYESWVVPSEDLFLRIDSKGPAEGGGINLHLQVWQRQRVLIKTDAVLRPDSPLFIRGPKWRDGSLIFVILTE